MKSIYILDDHKLFSGGLELLLQSIPELIKCRQFDDPAMVLHQISLETPPPDLIVVDFYIPGCNTPDLIRHLIVLCPATRILVVFRIGQSFRP